MTVPDFQSLMLPTLKSLRSGNELRIAKIYEEVASTENITEESLKEMLPSGKQTIFTNRVSWSLTYMMHAGLIKRVGRGVYQLTLEGQNLLSENPSNINIKFLREKYPSLSEWRESTGQNLNNDPVSPNDNAIETPEESLINTIQLLVNSLEFDVLRRVQESPPEFLEKVVIDLLIAMGYGGGDATMGLVTGRSGDGGIDGKIREDSLGLDEVYVQAKRYAAENRIGPTTLQSFVGALDNQNTNKGVFVTTSSFTRGAKDAVRNSSKRIVLIDGKELAHLMVRYNIGVRKKTTFEIKRIDEEYFDM